MEKTKSDLESSSSASTADSEPVTKKLSRFLILVFLIQAIVIFTICQYFLSSSQRRSDGRTKTEEDVMQDEIEKVVDWRR